MNRQGILIDLQCMFDNLSSGLYAVLSEDTYLTGYNVNALHLSSLELLEWFVDIESKYDIEITEQDITIKNLVDKIEHKIGETDEQ
ncbi:MAG: hypothetical protein ACYDEX_09015 [Mobilitalea sp.]